MNKPKFILERIPNPCDFSYRINILDGSTGHRIIERFNPESIQDIKYGDYSGLFGPPDKIMTDDELNKELQILFAHEAAPDMKEITGEAVDFLWKNLKQFYK